MIDIEDALAGPRAKRPSSGSIEDQLRRLTAGAAAVPGLASAVVQMADLRRRQLIKELQRQDTSEERHPTRRDIEQLLRTESERQTRSEEDSRMSIIRDALRKDAMLESIVPAAPDLIQDPDGVVRYVRRQDGEIIRIQ